MAGTIHLRVTQDILDFWKRLEDGHRSRELRRWLSYIANLEEEDSEEKWQRVLDEHQPIVEMAKRKKEESRERKLQAANEVEKQRQQKENNLKALLEAFGRYDFRVGDFPPTMIRHFAELLKMSSGDIKALLTEESKKRGMM